MPDKDDLFTDSKLIEHDIELKTDTLEVREVPFAPTTLSANAKTVLEKRYLKRDEEGNIIETPKELFLRVAKAIAYLDAKYHGDIDKMEEVFYRLMASLDFLPNSPTLMNAGRDLGQLSACFVLPVEDSIEGIFEAVKNTALIHKSGGGTGFSFSRLRPKNSIVRTTNGLASGPISFMQAFNAATEAVKQGGTRRGANMAILRVDHPDILEFISCKTSENCFTNFNISVAATEKFMDAMLTGCEYDLISPHNKTVVGSLSAREVFDKIVECAWKNGEPGIIFLDRINRDNPTPELGEIESTNPCGEQPLLSYESCNLGSINLDHMVKSGEVDWERLKHTIHASVHFLDNVIDANRFPLPQIRDMTFKTRKIGLGVMGFADMLYQLRIPYDSEEAIALAEKVMRFIQEEARVKSAELAQTRGPYPAWRQDRPFQRNATVTTIAPTGTISMIADASSGIEPNFALAYVKNVLDGKSLHYLNRRFEESAISGGFYSPELTQALINGESLDNLTQVPPDIRRVFRTAQNIEVKWHIRMQAVFQKYTDNAVSKTINFPFSATEKDIKEAFLMAYRLGCKGLTVYRDGSRVKQVLKSGDAKVPAVSDDKASPTPRKRPRITKGVTEKVNTGDGPLFVTINEDMEGVCELFATIGKHGGNAASQSEAIGRLISLCLRCGIDSKMIIKQLKNIAGPNPVWDDGQLILSTPDAIAKVLERHIERREKTMQTETKSVPEKKYRTTGDTCPDCGGVLVYSEGCSTCHSCGYSKCG
jgi:ribonucleoside-diphosphate reductase alpha chain